MIKKYKIKLWWRIFTPILSILLIISYIYGVYFHLWNEWIPETTQDWFLLTLSLVIGLACISPIFYWTIDYLKSQLIIDDNKITDIGIFWSKSLKFSDIAWIEIDYPAHIHIYPKNDQLDILKISMSYSGMKEWSKFLEEKFDIIDEDFEYEQELVNEIVEDPNNSDLWKDEPEVVENFNKLLLKVNVLKIFTLWIIFTFFYFSPSFSLKYISVFIIFILLFQIYILIVSNLNKGLLDFNNDNEVQSEHLSVWWILSTNIWISSYLIFDRFRLLDFNSDFLLFFFLISIGIFILLINTYKKFFNKSLINKSLFLALSLIYSYSNIVAINVITTTPNEQIIKVAIMDKEIKSTIFWNKHYIKAMPLSPLIKEKYNTFDILITKQQYNLISKHNEFDYKLKEWFLNIPWQHKKSYK